MNISYNFKNKYALITGGTHGIGLAITLLLAKNGCNVAFIGRDKDKHKSTINLVKKYNVDYLSLIGDVLEDKQKKIVLIKL